MQLSSVPAKNEFNLGLAAPYKNEVGDIITSLSFPCLAVPVVGSNVVPLAIRFGSLIAPLWSITSSPFAYNSNNSCFLLDFASFAAFFEPNF
jgi:hypothetical protein